VSNAPARDDARASGGERDTLVCIVPEDGTLSVDARRRTNASDALAEVGATADPSRGSSELALDDGKENGP